MNNGFDNMTDLLTKILETKAKISDDVEDVEETSRKRQRIMNKEGNYKEENNTKIDDEDDTETKIDKLVKILTRHKHLIENQGVKIIENEAMINNLKEKLEATNKQDNNVNREEIKRLNKKEEIKRIAPPSMAEDDNDNKDDEKVKDQTFNNVAHVKNKRNKTKHEVLSSSIIERVSDKVKVILNKEMPRKYLKFLKKR